MISGVFYRGVRPFLSFHKDCLVEASHLYRTKLVVEDRTETTNKQITICNGK